MRGQLQGEVGFVGIWYLMVVGGLFTYGALKARWKLAKGPLPQRTRHFGNVIVTQILMATFAFFVAKQEWIWLLVPPKWSTLDFVIAAGMLVSAVAAVFPLWRRSVKKRARVAQLFMPRNPKERLLWAIAALSAGVCEELVYRGVMFVLLSRLLGDPLYGALASAGLFALAHLLQSWISVAIIFVFALAFQYLCWRTDSLYLAMAVHFLYDLIAGIAYGYLGAKHGYSASDTPAGL